MKKSGLIIVALIVLITSVSGLSSCSLFEEKYEDIGQIKYSLLNDKDGWSVSGSKKGLIVDIPSEYDGLPVKEIGKKAFEGWIFGF